MIIEQIMVCNDHFEFFQSCIVTIKDLFMVCCTSPLRHKKLSKFFESLIISKKLYNVLQPPIPLETREKWRELLTDEAVGNYGWA